MKVAIDNKPLESDDRIRGIGEYTRRLVQALKKQTERKNDLIIELVDTKKINIVDYDLIHIPYFQPFIKTIPDIESRKLVVTIHDLIPLIFPKQYQPGVRSLYNFQLQKRRLKRIKAIICDSETSKKDIARFLDVSHEKIFPVYLAAAKHFKKLPKNSSDLLKVKNKYKLPEKFVLYVGDINYNKNVLGLIKACELIKTNLIIVGKQAAETRKENIDLYNIKGPRDWIRFLFNKPHPEIVHYRDLYNEFKANKKIFRLGFVSDEDLAVIYNLATVYCQPSFYEGFGLPVLEAMACGTPVVITRTQALVEIFSDAVLIADPKNPKSIAKTLLKVLNNSEIRNVLTAKGLAKAKEFSWEKTAEQTIEIYKKVITFR